MELILMRHGIAEEAGPRTGHEDAPRRLTDEGARRTRAAARGLASLGVDGADAILASPLTRCLETARIVGEILGAPAAADPRLAPGMRLAGLADVLDEHAGAGRVIVCGHQPDLSRVCAELTGGQVEFRKGAAAVIDLARPRAGAGLLRALYPPAALRLLGGG